MKIKINKNLIVQGKIGDGKACEAGSHIVYQYAIYANVEDLVKVDEVNAICNILGVKGT